MGTFLITKKLIHPTKFACKVSFNGKPAEYHELESLDPASINASLQATADQAEESTASKQAVAVATDSLTLKNGKLVESTVVKETL